MVLGEQALPVRSARRARDQQRLALLACDLADGEGHGRGGDIDDHVDLPRVEPLAGDLRADVGLVLMVGEDDLDRETLGRRPEVLDGHEGRHPRARSGQGRVSPGLVVEDADPDDPVGNLGVGWLSVEAQHREERKNAYRASSKKTHVRPRSPHPDGTSPRLE